MKFKQPPSGGCVLKLLTFQKCCLPRKQPPSGGCVLKQLSLQYKPYKTLAAAFGRLCVETK